MTAGSNPVPTPDQGLAPLFDAVLSPHRSLSPLGFWLVMGGVATISFAAGIAFVLQGAWPVFGYFGLDVLLVYWAFRASYRSGRLYETVRLTRDQLVVRRVLPGGRTRTWAFQPYWLRIELSDPDEHHSRLTLSAQGKAVTIGSFLTPQERFELADALRSALRRAQGPA
jgi:uncharacterized membrane protein